MEGYVKIKLDNYNYACHAGQTLVGKVECMVRAEETIRAIRIKFKGRSRVKWHANKRDYIGEDIYFDEVFNLVGGDQDVTIPPGTHTYPFSYILPNTPLPAPFTGDYGSVKYKIRVTVDRPWKSDYEHEFLLNVISPFDLNGLPGIRNPFSRSIEETIGSCCFASGSITFSISLPFTGYACGQQLNVRTYIKNMSNVNVDSVKYEIIRTAEFISRRPKSTRQSEYIVAMERATGIGAHAEKSWTTGLAVSPAETPNLSNCSVINLTYRLKVKAILPFPHLNLKISCPLMFGSEPLTITGPAQLNSSATSHVNEASPFLQNASAQDVGPSAALKQPLAPPPYGDV